MHEQVMIDHISERLNISDCSVKVISLMASEDTLIKRIGGDVEKGIRTTDVLDRSIAKIPLYRELDSIKVYREKNSGGNRYRNHEPLTTAVCRFNYCTDGKIVAKTVDKARKIVYTVFIGNEAEETQARHTQREWFPWLKDSSLCRCGIPPPAALPNRTSSRAVFPRQGAMRRTECA